MNAAMKMLPPSAVAMPAASSAEATVEDLQPVGLDQVAGAPRTAARGRRALRRRRRRRARSRSARTRARRRSRRTVVPASVSAIAIAMKNSGTHSPSLRPLSTLRPWRIRDGTRSSETTAWPSAASVHASTIASTQRLREARCRARRPRRQRPGDDRERQADPEQRTGTANSLAQRPQRDPRRVGEQHERQRDLGEQLHLLALDLEVEQPEHRPDEQAGGREEHRARDVQPLQPPRDRRVGDQQRRDRRQGPGHRRPIVGDRPRPLNVARTYPRRVCASHTGGRVRAQGCQRPCHGRPLPANLRA